MKTSTSQFGVSKRESHDSQDFYRRFNPPLISADETVNTSLVKNEIFIKDSRDMSEMIENSVALVVTSPPYFAGKEYEYDLTSEGLPSTYLEYLDLLHSVFSESYRVLEPGGRIAINVANLGRKPYRSLSSDVSRILEGIGFLLRGEIIWQKAEGANGNCAWGSFQSAKNPVLRDTTERIVVASKGRFDRAVHWKERRHLGLPFEDTISRADFMAWTLDVWRVQPESAKRVGHPAPFPVEIPKRLIELYSFKADLILDPFIGSGTTALAALSSERNFIGYELDPNYVQLIESRLATIQPKLNI